MAAEPSRSALASARFPSWQPAYEAALHSTDTRALFKLVEVAESVMLVRRDLLSGDSRHHAELYALEQALRMLAVIKKERLLFPSASV